MLGEAAGWLAAAAWCWWKAAAGVACAVALAVYLLPNLYLAYLAPRQNLKRKYGAEWALVTGASSGIGRALVQRLAQQGLNVVLVALDDALLQRAHSEVSAEFPKQRFVACGCNLGQRGYLDTIKRCTKDLPISIVMNNAGYLLMGFFRQKKLAEHLANVECNTLSAVSITHHFLARMTREKRRGCITFTSSAAGYFPSPFVCMYGAGKAFLSEFACSLAPETKDQGIDVFCVHPSFTATNLYNNGPKLSILALLEKFAATPLDVADVIVQGVGRGLVWRDTGAYAIVTRLLPRIIDIPFLTWATTLFRRTLADYRKFVALPTVDED